MEKGVFISTQQTIKKFLKEILKNISKNLPEWNNYQTSINLNLALDKATIAAKITKTYTELVDTSIKILVIKTNRNKPYKINMNEALYIKIFKNPC